MFVSLFSPLLQRTPRGVTIMRISTDTPPDRLVAPKWKMKKGQFHAYLLAEMERRGARQGLLTITAAP